MIIKDLGAVSAYAYAVEKGYTGTEEEFAVLMASYATVAEEAAESAESASASAESASASASTATTKASEASTSATQASASATSASQLAQTATTKASEASASASTAGTKASEASASASTASSKASEASQSASDAQTAQGLAESARDDAIDAKTDAETARDLAQQYAESIDPENIFSAYATDTASGAVATFADGADDIAMKSVKVAIEPVQDLHGQEAPYPAGGGKNLLNNTATSGAVDGIVFTINSDGTVNVSGTASANAYYKVCEITLPAGSYVLSGCPANGSTSTYRLYDDANWTDTGSGATITLSESTLKKIYIRVNNGVTVNNLQFKPMICYSSATDPTVFAPYSNICPISGWTGAEVVRTGKNLLNPDILAWSVGRTYRYMHDVVPADTPARFTFIDKDTSVDISGMYIGFSKENLFENSPKSYSWTINNGVMQSNQSNSAVNGTSGVLCSNVMIYPNTEEVFNALFARYYIMVELGSTATEYEPYTGDTYAITLPTEAGTVYGGELDVTNGVLTVDRAMVDLGTLDWNKSGDSPSGGFIGISRLNDANAKKFGRANVISDTYAPNLAEVGIPNIPNFTISGQSDSNNVYVRNDSATSGAELKTMLSGVYACYELATPITYTLTPTEIKSLLGNNNVWADAGDTAVTYRADTTKYIDKKIAEIVLALS